MLKELSTVKSELKFYNQYWEYWLDQYVMPSGDIGDYHYVSSRGSTMIIPQKDNGNFIMIKQFRYLNKKLSLEFPGGGIKPNLKPVENAIEELKEEVGLFANNTKYLGQYNPFNGVTNEISHIFYMSDLRACGSNPEPSEEFEILEISKSEIIQKISKGEIWDGMTLAAWAMYYFSPLNKVQ